jgi:hypothetical protein
MYNSWELPDGSWMFLGIACFPAIVPGFFEWQNGLYIYKAAMHIRGSIRSPVYRVNMAAESLLWCCGKKTIDSSVQF